MRRSAAATMRSPRAASAGDAERGGRARRAHAVARLARANAASCAGATATRCATASMALAAATTAHDSEAQAELLNTLERMAYAALRTRTTNASSCSVARSPSPGERRPGQRKLCLANLAEVLHAHAGTIKGSALARDGLAVSVARSNRDSLRAVHLRDHVRPRQHRRGQGRPRQRAAAARRAAAQLPRALRGRHRARGRRRRTVPRWRSRTSPSSSASSPDRATAAIGRCRCRSGPELHRRRRDLPGGARRRGAEALDRLELGTEDVIRIARVTAAGMRIEAELRAARARPARQAGRARCDRAARITSTI